MMHNSHITSAKLDVCAGDTPLSADCEEADFNFYTNSPKYAGSPTPRIQTLSTSNTNARHSKIVTKTVGQDSSPPSTHYSENNTQSSAETITTPLKKVNDSKKHTHFSENVNVSPINLVHKVPSLQNTPNLIQVKSMSNNSSINENVVYFGECTPFAVTPARSNYRSPLRELDDEMTSPPPALTLSRTRNEETLETGSCTAEPVDQHQTVQSPAKPSPKVQEMTEEERAYERMKAEMMPLIGDWETVVSVSENLEPILKAMGVSMFKRKATNTCNIGIHAEFASHPVDGRPVMELSLRLPMGVRRSMYFYMDGKSFTVADPDAGDWMAIVEVREREYRGEKYNAVCQVRQGALGTVYESRRRFNHSEIGECMHIQYEAHLKNGEKLLANRFARRLD